MALLPDKADSGSWTLPGAAVTLIGVAVHLLGKVLHWDAPTIDAVVNAVIAVGVVVMALGFRRLGGDIKVAVQNGNTPRDDAAEAAKRGG